MAVYEVAEQMRKHKSTVCARTVHSRIALGWDIESACTKPVNKMQKECKECACMMAKNCHACPHCQAITDAGAQAILRKAMK